MAITGFNKIGKAIDSEGKFHYAYAFKPTTPIPITPGFFVDLNQSSGIPKYNAFAGSQLTFTPLEGFGNAGLYPGNFIPGSTKHLVRWQATNVAGSTGVPPDYIYLMDYLGFYPLVDCDDLDLQVCDNTQTLPRYTDGEGVRIVLIVQAPMSFTAACTITYTNSYGVTGRSSTFNVVPGTSIGVCATGSGSLGGGGQANPFFPLANGDTGVRAIESVQMLGGAGGFMCAALVKPLANIRTYEQSVPSEKMFGIENQNIPEIKQGAYLNFMVQRSGVLAGSYYSELIFMNT